MRRPQLDGSEPTIFVFQGNTTEGLDLKHVSSLAPRPASGPGAALRAMSGGVEVEVGSWLFLQQGWFNLLSFKWRLFSRQ